MLVALTTYDAHCSLRCVSHTYEGSQELGGDYCLTTCVTSSVMVIYGAVFIASHDYNHTYMVSQ